MTATAAGIIWHEDPPGQLLPYVVNPDGSRGDQAVWAPQPGSQEAFLSCPVFECCLEGNRGGGKTDVLLMDFAQHVGQGFGADWRGALFRQSFPQLSDVIAKSKKWFPQIFPEAKYNEQKSTWAWPTGETLRFSFAEREDDYWNFHGHAYPWMAFEELTTWPDPSVFKIMMTLCRSTNPRCPRKYRATTNPYGPGHNWVKMRYNLPIAPGRIVGGVITPETDEPQRVAVHSDLAENRVLMAADPQYVQKLRAAARNPAMLAAWLKGSWDIVAGGMFDDVWDPLIHVLPADTVIPRSWRLDRSFDWGSSKPFSVGFWAESDGTPLVLPGGQRMSTVKGDLVRVAEWYGWRGQANEGLRMTAREVAQGIRDLEKSEYQLVGRRVSPGPADNSIFDVVNGASVARDMAREGVRWIRCDKSSGSRRNGWERLRTLMKGAHRPADGTPREQTGLFVLASCEQFLRTVPVLPRDDRDLDDVDSQSEDHVGDESRYRVYRTRGRMVTKKVRGR